ncbi:VanZ family protein [Amphibacillus sediminis]|uniref:VanZ family protein n=1 Tax=Amphibacillus sediminis TaxID=360185 RepID=UPI00082967E9|nr:VanZ family protein [Amphibacillus sediminis]
MLELRFIPFIAIGYPLWLLLRRGHLVKHKKKISLLNETVVQVFFIYILVVIYLTFRPFTFQIPFIGPRPFSFDTNLFYQLSHMADGYFHLQLLYSLGNIMMFVPFGMLAPVVFRPLRHPILLIGSGFLFSLMIELTQALFTLTRYGTVDDLFFNTTGAVLGYFVYLYARSFEKSK